MTDDDWKTLRVPPEAWQRAKEQKEVADRTWGEQIQRPNADDATLEDVVKTLSKIDKRLQRVEKRLSAARR